MGPYGIIYVNGNKLCDRDQQICVELMPPKNERTVVLEKGSNDGNESSIPVFLKNRVDVDANAMS